MKLHELTEMTMKANRRTHLMMPYLKFAEQRVHEFEHVGDIEDVKVLRHGTEYLLQLNGSTAAFFQVLENPVTLQVALVLPEFQRAGLFSKFMHFLKRYLSFNEIKLSDVISTDMYEALKSLSNRFNISLVKGNDRVKYTADTIMQYLSNSKPTGWQVVLENDGDFSSWPLFFDWRTPDIRQHYDWLLEEVKW